jgi:hypothetical protein
VPYRVLTLQALTEAVAPDAREVAADQLVESALLALEADGWHLVTVGTDPDGAPWWYFRQDPDRITGRMSNMR